MNFTWYKMFSGNLFESNKTLSWITWISEWQDQVLRWYLRCGTGPPGPSQRRTARDPTGTGGWPRTSASPSKRTWRVGWCSCRAPSTTGTSQGSWTATALRFQLIEDQRWSHMYIPDKGDLLQLIQIPDNFILPICKSWIVSWHLVAQRWEQVVSVVYSSEKFRVIPGGFGSKDTWSWSY